jgi:hypothetical protein
MPDPRHAAAVRTGARAPRWIRWVGWALSVALWAIASDGRPILALLALLAATLVRGVYVITTHWGKGRSVFWSPWFFAVAALCEVAWLVFG